MISAMIGFVNAAAKGGDRVAVIAAQYPMPRTGTGGSR
jgi:hypothetical protein